MSDQSHRDCNANSLFPFRNVSVSPKLVIGPTEFVWPTLCLPITEIGLTEFMWSVSPRLRYALTLMNSVPSSSRVTMLCLSMEERQHLHNSSNFIIKYVIGKLTFSCKIIWLNICGLTLSTSRCIGYLFYSYIWDNLIFIWLVDIFIWLWNYEIFVFCFNYLN